MAMKKKKIRIGKLNKGIRGTQPGEEAGEQEKKLIAKKFYVRAKG